VPQIYTQGYQTLAFEVDGTLGGKVKTLAVNKWRYKQAGSQNFCNHQTTNPLRFCHEICSIKNF